MKCLQSSTWRVPYHSVRSNIQLLTKRHYQVDPALLMRRRALKSIPDTLHPNPSLQHTTLLNDLIPSLAYQPTSRALPQGAHLVYFPPLQPASELAVDGADADHVPPGFPLSSTWDGGRRLWAGGEVVFEDGWEREAVVDGRRWLCREEIEDVRSLSGGRYVVDVLRKYGPGGMDFIKERRTLAFVPGTADGPTPKRMIKPTLTPTRKYTLTPTLTHLFHFSALTYNAHFIHLHPTSALVHGPLLLSLMLRALTSQPSSGGIATQRLRSIAYRNLAPLYVGRQLTVCMKEDGGRKVDVWVEGDEGGMAVKGKAVMVQ